jgi:hypothetical protein
MCKNCENFRQNISASTKVADLGLILNLDPFSLKLCFTNELKICHYLTVMDDI